jgi:hypothetical protein
MNVSGLGGIEKVFTAYRRLVDANLPPIFASSKPLKPPFICLLSLFFFGLSTLVWVLLECNSSLLFLVIFLIQ